jgi:hypothetical protein
LSARASIRPWPERLLEDAVCAAKTAQRGERGDWWVGEEGPWRVEVL